MARGGLSVAALIVAVSAGAGCGAIGSLTGSQVQVGAEAVPPVDFPMPPPGNAEIASVVQVTVGGVATTTVQYVAQGKPDELLSPYVELMQDRGLRVEVAPGAVSGLDEETGERWSARVGSGDGGQLVSLVVSRR